MTESSFANPVLTIKVSEKPEEPKKIEQKGVVVESKFGEFDPILAEKKAQEALRNLDNNDSDETM